MKTQAQTTAANSGERVQFRFAVDILWPGMAEFVSRLASDMKTSYQIIGALMGFLVISGCGCRTRPMCIIQAVPRTFPKAEVAGLWIGFTTTDTDLYRLELRPDSTGVLTQAYTSTSNQESLRFEISRWDLATDNILTCSFSQRDAEDSLKSAWPVKMTCQVTGTRIESLLCNGEGGWKENIIFWRENDFDGKWRLLRQ